MAPHGQPLPADRPKALELLQRPAGRWAVLRRDKLNLDIFWLKDESLESSDNLPDPDILAAEIVEDLRAALEQFEAIQTDLAAGPAALRLPG